MTNQPARQGGDGLAAALGCIAGRCSNERDREIIIKAVNALRATRDAAEGAGEITVPLCESFAAIGWDISERDLRKFEGALFRRGLNVAPLMPAPPKPAPGHTALIVTPESLDAFMEKNPLPASDAVGALALAKQLQHAKDEYDDAVGRGQFPRFIQEKKESIDFLLWCNLKDIIEWLQIVSLPALETEVPTTPVLSADGASETDTEIADRLEQTYKACGDRWFKLAADRLRRLPSGTGAAEPAKLRNC